VPDGRRPKAGFESPLPVPDQFMQSLGSNTFRIRDAAGNLRPATSAQCIGLEGVAASSPEQAEQRLRDHFAGRPNPDAERMKARAGGMSDSPEVSGAWRREVPARSRNDAAGDLLVELGEADPSGQADVLRLAAAIDPWLNSPELGRDRPRNPPLKNAGNPLCGRLLTFHFGIEGLVDLAIETVLLVASGSFPGPLPGTFPGTHHAFLEHK
jgi:hypothetical protein